MPVASGNISSIRSDPGNASVVFRQFFPKKMWSNSACSNCVLKRLPNGQLSALVSNSSDSAAAWTMRMWMDRGVHHSSPSPLWRLTINRRWSRTLLVNGIHRPLIADQQAILQWTPLQRIPTSYCVVCTTLEHHDHRDHCEPQSMNSRSISIAEFQFEFRGVRNSQNFRSTAGGCERFLLQF